MKDAATLIIRVRLAKTNASYFCSDFDKRISLFSKKKRHRRLAYAQQAPEGEGGGMTSQQFGDKI